MTDNINRRSFVKTATFAGLSIGLAGKMAPLSDVKGEEMKRVGIIGLDTSHCIAFTKTLNASDAGPEYSGYKVVAAYPKGSNDIKSSAERIPGYTNDIRSMGVEITGSIDELLGKADVIMLETNDGRLHLGQALQVMKAGKRMFIDKPVAASLSDTISIFRASKHYNIPVFTSSSLRFEELTQEIASGKIGKILGADTFSPATIEKTHPDLYWYGIHGVEILFTLMGRGCKSVSRTFSENTDIAVGLWNDNRIGTFRGTRSGIYDIGGTVFGEKANMVLGKDHSYNPMLVRIIEFFKTGVAPVTAEETIEIFAFMSAADESKHKGGAAVELEAVLKKAEKHAMVF